MSDDTVDADEFIGASDSDDNSDQSSFDGSDGQLAEDLESVDEQPTKIFCYVVESKTAARMYRQEKLRNHQKVNKTLFFAALHAQQKPEEVRSKNGAQIIRRVQYLYHAWIQQNPLNVLNQEFLRALNEDRDLCIRIWQRHKGRPIACHRICFDCGRRETNLHFNGTNYALIVNQEAFFRSYHCFKCSATFSSRHFLDEHDCSTYGKSEVRYPNGVFQSKRTVVDSLANLGITISPDEAVNLLYPQHYCVFSFAREIP